ncbi:MAG: septum formation family protein [Actinomycetes bacterium]
MRKSLVIVASLVLASACSGDKLTRDDAGNVIKRGNSSIFELKVGDCTKEELKAEATNIGLVPCTEPHTHEAYFSVDYVGDAYPGSATLEVFAEQKCVGAFADYVGVELAQSNYFFTYLYPSVTTWQSKNDRQVMCFVVSRNEMLMASVKGTAS